MTVAIAGLIVGGVGAVAGAKIASDATKDASRESRAGMDAATAEQSRQYDQTREDYAPWREMGEGAIGRMEDVMQGKMNNHDRRAGHSTLRMGKSFQRRFPGSGSGHVR